MNALITIMARRQKIIRAFKNASAVNTRTAIDTRQYGLGESVVFDKLVRERILVNTGEHHFYLDEITEDAHTKLRRKITITVLIGIAMLALLIILFVKGFLDFNI